MLDNTNSKKQIWIVAKESMVARVSHLISPGDAFLVSHDSKYHLKRDQLCLISKDEKQWVEKYWPGLKKRYKNVYPILQVIWKS